MVRIVMCLLACLPSLMALNAQDNHLIKPFWNKSKQQPDSPEIKVLIAHDVKDASIQVRGKYRLVDPHTNRNLGMTTIFTGKKATPIEVAREGIKWGEEFPDVYQIQIQPACKNTVISVNGLDYKGFITVYNVDHTNRSISIVNELPIEEYLAYVLFGKIPDNTPQEALSAAAIAARTTAYYQSLNPRSPFWSVDGRQVGYQGYIAADPNTPLRKVLAQTRHMILSRTGAYEGLITPFLALWPTNGSSPSQDREGVSQIPFSQTLEMAERGDHAAAILEKAFPHTSIQMIQMAPR